MQPAFIPLRRPGTPRPSRINLHALTEVDSWNVARDFPTVFTFSPNVDTPKFVAVDDITGAIIHLTPQKLKQAVEISCALALGLRFIEIPPWYMRLAVLLNTHIPPRSAYKFSIKGQSGQLFKSTRLVGYSHVFPPNSTFLETFRDEDLVDNTHRLFPRLGARSGICQFLDPLHQASGVF
ncbi:hypothetical protein L218DRAFT_947708 [Marasmius fiardii PR-910]|nr:hypothetical protein L218DRAFT_947708 [Marasmius fiardii PR-910]